MTPSSPLTLVLTHTPVWAWVLLTTLLVLGLAQARDRSVARGVALGLPAAMAVWSLVTAETGLGRPAATSAAWVAGVALVVLGARQAGWPQGIRVAGTGRVFIPGSWLPLGVFLGLFMAKFFVGAAQGMHLPLVSTPGFAPAMGFVYGAFSGVFAARGLAVWQAVGPRVVRLLRPSEAA